MSLNRKAELPYEIRCDLRFCVNPTQPLFRVVTKIEEEVRCRFLPW